MNTLTPRQAVGRAVRGLMAESGMTQTRLAEETGRSRTSLVKKLRGDIALTMDDLHAIAAALDVPWSEIVANAERIQATKAAAS